MMRRDWSDETATFNDAQSIYWRRVIFVIIVCWGCLLAWLLKSVIAELLRLI